MRHSSSDSLCRHAPDVPFTGNYFGYVGIGHGLSERDGEHDFPHPPPERCGPHADRRYEVWRLTKEKAVEPQFGFPEDRQVVTLRVVLIQRICKKLLPIKPLAYKRLAIRRHGDTTQWREIMGDEVHAGAIVLDTTYKSRVINASKILLNC